MEFLGNHYRIEAQSAEQGFYGVDVGIIGQVENLESFFVETRTWKKELPKLSDAESVDNYVRGVIGIAEDSVEELLLLCGLSNTAYEEPPEDWERDTALERLIAKATYIILGSGKKIQIEDPVISEAAKFLNKPNVQGYLDIWTKLFPPGLRNKTMERFFLELGKKGMEADFASKNTADT